MLRPTAGRRSAHVMRLLVLSRRANRGRTILCLMLRHRSVTPEPCLPRPAKEPPAGPGWIHEIKHDGFRILARRDNGRVRLFTRNGYDFSARFPKIAAAVENLPVRSCVVDGEADRRRRTLSIFNQEGVRQVQWL
jgi:ATP-dependent DNA ligase